MATYKIIQDIEADDKILGPLTIKHLLFLFAAGVIFSIFGWLPASKISGIFWFIGFFLASPFIFLGLPLGRDQPNEVWLMAKINFFFRPKQRVWTPNAKQTKVVFEKTKEAAPQKMEQLDETQVLSNAQILSDILDSRGRVGTPDELQSVQASTGQQPEPKPTETVNQKPEPETGPDPSQSTDDAAVTQNEPAGVKTTMEDQEAVNQQEERDNSRKARRYQKMLKAKQNDMVNELEADLSNQKAVDAQHKEIIEQATSLEDSKKQENVIMDRIAQDGDDLRISTLAKLAQQRISRYNDKHNDK